MMKDRSIFAGNLEDAIDKYRTIDRLKATARQRGYANEAGTPPIGSQAAL
jgi:hypothetical protein